MNLPTELRQEIATVARDIFVPSFLGIFRIQDSVLLSRGGALGLRLYDDLERDCQVYGEIQKRKLAVVSREWQVDPATSSRLDRKAADLVRAQLANLGVPSPDNPADQVSVASNFDLACFNLLDALMKGYAVGEIMWDTDGTELVAREIRPRDQRRFEFGIDYQLRLKTLTNPMPGDEMPARKFLVHSFGAKDGNPHGLGLGNRLFWPVFFKRQDISFWLTFLDKFGSPTSLGKYPAGAPDPDKRVLLDALDAIAQDTGITIPDNMQVEFLEAARGGSASYEQMVRYMDEQISFTILGAAQGAKHGGGAMAAAAITQSEVRLELVKADADLLSATLNSTLATWLTQLNVPGANPPKIWRQVKAPADLKELSERDKNLFTLGYRPSLKQVMETYGGEWEAVPAPPAVRVGMNPNPQADPAPAFAETTPALVDEQQTLDAALRMLDGANLDAIMRKALAPLAQALKSGEQPQDALDRLAETYPDLDTTDLEDLLARALFVADVWGRLAPRSPADSPMAAPTP